MIKRDFERMIYCSSWDRGLEYLLRMFPEIKKVIPGCSLHIFYGENLFLAIHRNNPAKMRWLQQLKVMMEQPGIVNHGRVGHKELAEEFQKSGIWAYYCTFQEISCISAMKAQAYGAIPVTMDSFALAETVKNGIRIEGDPYDPVTQEEYKKALISLLKDHKRQEEIRKPMMDFAKDYFTWKKVSLQWDSLFRTSLNLNLPTKRKEVVK